MFILFHAFIALPENHIIGTLVVWICNCSQDLVDLGTSYGEGEDGYVNFFGKGKNAWEVNGLWEVSLVCDKCALNDYPSWSAVYLRPLSLQFSIPELIPSNRRHLKKTPRRDRKEPPRLLCRINKFPCVPPSYLVCFQTLAAYLICIFAVAFATNGAISLSAMLDLNVK